MLPVRQVRIMLYKVVVVWAAKAITQNADLSEAIFSVTPGCATVDFFQREPAYRTIKLQGLAKAGRQTS